MRIRFIDLLLVDKMEIGRTTTSPHGLWIASKTDPSFSGAPQGTVLVPLLSLYSHTRTCHLQKFSDDSAAVRLITNGDSRDFRRIVQDSGMVSAEPPPDHCWLNQRTGVGF